MNKKEAYEFGVKLAARMAVTRELLSEARDVARAIGKDLPRKARMHPHVGRTTAAEAAHGLDRTPGSWNWILRQLRKNMKETGKLPKELEVSGPKELFAPGVI